MKRINGQNLKEMFVSGSNNLYNHYPEIDALNVFPVPDGDTGMNMNLTMTSGAKEIQNRSDTNIYEISKAFSRGLLMGARGNSGVITSQIWRGFSMGLEGKEDIDVQEFIQAMEKGVEVAYHAVIKPVEGTILTVVKESTKYLKENLGKNTSFEKAFELLIEGGNYALEHTPELLPILKEADVVDSGGAGLIKIYEGMYEALKGNIVERQTLDENQTNLVAAGAYLEDEEFGYCTEFIMSLGPDTVKKPFNEKRFTNVLLAHGNSLVVVRDEDIVKVHVHTLSPGGVLNYAQQFGEFLKLKIENMTEQHRALEEGALAVEDMHTDLIEEPEEPHERVENAIIAVSSGDGIDEIFKELGVAHIVKGGQTMNPSSEDFVSAIKKVNANNVYILPNNGNIVMAATQAAELVSDENTKVYVIPTKTIPEGITAATMFDPESDAEHNVESLSDAVTMVKSGEVTFSIRDTTIFGVTIKKDEFMGICHDEILSTGRAKDKVLLKLLRKMVDEDSSVITVLYGQDVTDEEAAALQEKVESTFEDLDVQFVKGNQPVYSFLIGVQ